MDTWEKDGKKASKHFIRVTSIQFLGGNGEGKKDADPNGKTQQPANQASSSNFSDEDDIPF
jgi:single-stranded DNA-binding protein